MKKDTYVKDNYERAIKIYPPFHPARTHWEKEYALEKYTIRFERKMRSLKKIEKNAKSV